MECPPLPKNIVAIGKHYSKSSYQYDSKNLPILRNVAPNSVSVNSVVNAMAQIGSGEEAEKYLYFILGDDYQPDDYTLSSDDDELKKGLHKLNIEANTMMINSVINAWIRCGTRQGVERAESILDKVLRDGEDNADILPNFISFSTVIHGCKYASMSTFHRIVIGQNLTFSFQIITVLQNS